MKGVYVIILIAIVTSLILLSLVFKMNTEERSNEIVVTIKPISSLVSYIYESDIESIIPPGKNPHEWQPTPSVYTLLKNAKIVFATHPLLEPWAKTEKTIYLAENESDPHAWLSFTVSLQMVDKISEKLSELYPDKKSLISSRAEELKKIIQQIKEKCNQLEGKTIVELFPTLKLFAADCGMDEIHLIDKPGEEPNPSTLKERTQEAKNIGIDIFFAPSFMPKEKLESIEKVTGLKYISFDPLCSKGYIQTMNETVELMSSWLS